MNDPFAQPDPRGPRPPLPAVYLARLDDIRARAKRNAAHLAAGGSRDTVPHPGFPMVDRTPEK